MDERRDLCWIGEVGRMGRAAEVRSQLLDGRRASRDQRNVRALRREAAGERFADPSRRASDEHSPSPKLHVGPPFVVSGRLPIDAL
jgi:hypothetical protein